ncbi:hypothetical protein [Desulfovibrio sp. Huiquan2017]|uniref:hypothetical protein n=1 Tax=Desulfovibrio sp. Huiquan2017 TaxID=2816861 RepID=UPI001A939CFD|nr:hypothetical protein [Desulfovibrio sp. Huiquan2017]
MQHDDTKAQGLLRLLTQGLLAHAEQKTASELGDRSQYIGMSDIGKGMECMRAAVASKLGMSAIPAATAVDGFAPDDVACVLGRQIILQRGHWQEYGIEKALAATGVKLVPQLEISIEHNGVLIKAHLDFTLVWGGQRPAVRILELKSNERIPDSLYSSYEAQLYGQVGLLKSCWAEPCFSVPQTEVHSTTFPQAVEDLFGVMLPLAPDTVDIEAWVLSISMSEVKPFGPYLPDQVMGHVGGMSANCCGHLANSGRRAIWQPGVERPRLLPGLPPSVRLVRCQRGLPKVSGREHPLGFRLRSGARRTRHA